MIKEQTITFKVKSPLFGYKRYTVTNSEYGPCQNTHWSFNNGNMACNAHGVWLWKDRRWIGGYHEAQTIIRLFPKQKSIFDNLSKKDIEQILND